MMAAALPSLRSNAPKRATAIRQEQILSAAMGLIEQKGLRGLNMAALARQVGVVPSALYRHFRAKRHIVALILDRLREILQDNLRSVREESPESCARLRLLLDRHFTMLKESPGIPRLIFADDLGASFPGHKVKVLGILMEYMEGIEAIVREGQTSGCLRPDIRAAGIARLYLGLIQSASVMFYLSEGRLEPGRNKEEVWEALEKALKVVGGPGRTMKITRRRRRQ